MEKTFLEEKIEEKAVSKFEDELMQLITALRKNRIGCKLKIEKDNLADYDTIKALPNFQESKNQVIKELIEEETEKILERLSDLEYLLQERKA